MTLVESLRAEAAACVDDVQPEMRAAFALLGTKLTMAANRIEELERAAETLGDLQQMFDRLTGLIDQLEQRA
jgi:hypothetical protein